MLNFQIIFIVFFAGAFKAFFVRRSHSICIDKKPKGQNTDDLPKARSAFIKKDHRFPITKNRRPLKEGSLWCQGLFFIIVKASSSSTFQRDMSTRQMLATAVLKNSGGLYSALSGLPSRKGQASHLQKTGCYLLYSIVCFFDLYFPQNDHDSY